MLHDTEAVRGAPTPPDAVTNAVQPNNSISSPVDQRRYGATPQDWAHFDLMLGLTADLLPVVSNPHAEISPDSKMKALGKTPSRFNGAGQVVGFAKWPTYTAVGRDIERWSADRRLGICLQTRHVRALDVDVDDGPRAIDIYEAFCAAAGIRPPVRTRNNSGKRLGLFVVQGDLTKRVIRVNGGIIELLANGQHAVIAGTHTSGARYEWQGGLPDDIPEISSEQLDAAWAALTERFAIEAPVSSRLTVRRRGIDLAIEDPVADYLFENGLVRDTTNDGALVVDCPWVKEHSEGAGDPTSTVWFVAGTNEHKLGHFKCLHSHCEHRTDSEFKQAIGFDETGFEPVTDLLVATQDRPPLPAFERDGRGRIEATLNNLVAAVERPDVAGIEVRKDMFRDEIVKAPHTGGAAQWQPLSDADCVELRCHLERSGFKPISRENLRDVIHLVAERRQFDTAQEWAARLIWDGVPRIDRFLTNYFGAADSPYVTAVSAYLWTALAGRVAAPGIKADMAPIFVGPQGAGKSTGVAALSPDLMYFREISLADDEGTKARKLRGCLVAELAELQGLHTREAEQIKAFVTRTHENWIPKYREHAVTFPRRCVFVGTTNQDEFLADETGNRRWLPVKVGTVDAAAVVRDREQLWAEGLARFRADGVAYAAAERLGRSEHRQYLMSDAWEAPILDWLRRPDAADDVRPDEREFVTISEVMVGALGLRHGSNDKPAQMRIGKILGGIGYDRVRKSVNGSQIKVWVRKQTA